MPAVGGFERADEQDRFLWTEALKKRKHVLDTVPKERR